VVPRPGRADDHYIDPPDELDAADDVVAGRVLAWNFG